VKQTQFKVGRGRTGRSLVALPEEPKRARYTRLRRICPTSPRPRAARRRKRTQLGGMLQTWAQHTNVHLGRRSNVTRRLASTRFQTRLGALRVKPLLRPLARLPSLACSSVRRVPLWVLWWAGLLGFFLPSRTLAQGSEVTRQTTNSSSAEPYVVGGLILAGVLVVLYIALRATQRRDWPDVAHVVAIVAPTTAITAGVRLGVVAITAKNLGPFVSEDRVFIPLAGLALLLVSTKAIYDVMRAGCFDDPPVQSADPRPEH
jgi:hypothetical protein